MSEYMFGVTRRKVSAREYAKRDQICHEEGGYGYTQINRPGNGWLGWYSGPNRGEPFNRNLAARVEAAVRENRS